MSEGVFEPILVAGICQPHCFTRIGMILHQSAGTK
jgi:hypothetical protein